jgi:hypothetical protein
MLRCFLIEELGFFYRPLKRDFGGTVILAMFIRVAVMTGTGRVHEEGGRWFASRLWRLGDFKWRNIARYKWLIKNRAATPSVIVSNRINDRFDPTLRFCEDHELWLRIAFHHGPFVELVGPPLTRLGRSTMAPGGQSSQIHRMRAGEMRMYAKFCGSRPLYLLLLPLLWWWSLMKYIYFLLRRNRAVLKKK